MLSKKIYEPQPNFAAIVWGTEKCDLVLNDANQGYAEFYYDGELRDHVEADPGVGLNETTYINIGDYRSRDGGRNFDGYIDDVAFFDIALNADQVKALYDSPETVNGGNVLDQGL